MNKEKRVIKTNDGYTIIQTSYRTWTILTPNGDDYYAFADPTKNMALRCSCLFSSGYERFRACKHIRYIKMYFDKDGKEIDKS